MHTVVIYTLITCALIILTFYLVFSVKNIFPQKITLESYVVSFMNRIVIKLMSNDVIGNVTIIYGNLSRNYYCFKSCYIELNCSSDIDRLYVIVNGKVIEHKVICK